MDSLETLVREAIKQGTPAETLASSFASILNLIEKEQKEKEEREKAAQRFQTKRNIAIEKLKQTSVIKRDTVTGLIAKITVLTTLSHLNWSDQKITLFNTYLSRMVSVAIAKFDDGSEKEDPVSQLFEGVDKLLEWLFGDKSPNTKQEEKEKEKINRPDGEYHFKGGQSSDREIIDQFIRKFNF